MVVFTCDSYIACEFPRGPDHKWQTPARALAEKKTILLECFMIIVTAALQLNQLGSFTSPFL